ncbi:hypothetical protein EEB13_31145 [Rhodococcus sp. WS3]|nr:hypothetical protein EEB13_31145 [Rhodococcus sp. WS3]
MVAVRLRRGFPCQTITNPEPAYELSTHAATHARLTPHVWPCTSTVGLCLPSCQISEQDDPYKWQLTRIVSDPELLARIAQWCFKSLSVKYNWSSVQVDEMLSKVKTYMS